MREAKLPVPAIVIAYVPVGALLETIIVIDEVADPPEGTGTTFGLNDTVIPTRLGTERETLPA